MKTLNDILTKALVTAWRVRKDRRGFDTAPASYTGCNGQAWGQERPKIHTLGTRMSPSDVRSTVTYISLNTRADFGVVSGARLTTRVKVPAHTGGDSGAGVMLIIAGGYGVGRRDEQSLWE